MTDRPPNCPAHLEVQLCQQLIKGTLDHILLRLFLFISLLPGESRPFLTLQNAEVDVPPEDTNTNGAGRSRMGKGCEERQGDKQVNGIGQVKRDSCPRGDKVRGTSRQRMQRKV